MRVHGALLLVSILALLCLISSKQIEDCKCESSTIDYWNDHEIYAKFHQLRKEKFFSIFKINLNTPCPFWRDNGMCSKKSCAVCGVCDEDEIPESWRSDVEEEASELGASEMSPVDRTLWAAFKGWSEDEEDMWIVQDSGDKISYVDITLNPEGHTGYEGFDAWKIWAAIYQENCFVHSKDLQDMCFEQRVFYRIISGLHSAISAHVSAVYPISKDDDRTAPNLEVFEEKLGNYPERINNLYFAFAFLLRALNKASPLLNDFDYSIGRPQDDARVQQRMRALLSSELIAKAVPDLSFDESVMFSNPASGQPLDFQLKQQFRAHFRNISRIIDCVACEKCKLHGKLQVLGLGTAFKILFSDRELTKKDLNRNEVIALINTVGKFSNAIRIVHEMQWKRQKQTYVSYFILLALVGVLSAMLFMCVVWCRRRAMRKARARARRDSQTGTAASAKDKKNL